MDIELGEYEDLEESDNDTSEVQEIEMAEVADYMGELVDASMVSELQMSDEIFDVDKLEDITVEDNDLEMDGLIRDILDQDVNEQRLPSDARVEWSEEGRKGNSDCILRDDAEFVIKFKSSGENKTYTGAEFKSYMRDRYGRDYVTYSHKEPDFEPFEQSIDKEEFEQFLFDKYGKHIEVLDIPEGHVEVESMGTNRANTYGVAYDYILEILGDEVSKKDLEEYMQEKDLTWHECGDKKTIRMIPTEINQVFSHTGGIGIEKDYRALIAELVDDVLTDADGNKHGFAFQRGSMVGKAEGLEEAINFRHRKFREKKRELF